LILQEKLKFIPNKNVRISTPPTGFSQAIRLIESDPRPVGGEEYNALGRSDKPGGNGALCTGGPIPAIHLPR